MSYEAEAPPPVALPQGSPPQSSAPVDDRDSRSVSRGPPPPVRSVHAPAVATPTNVIGVFGLSIRTTDADLYDEFGRHGKVEKALVVYDQRSQRSRGFGFVTMGTVEEAEACIKELNGMDLHGRRIRVDFSATQRPHQATPGEYRGEKRRDDFPRGGGNYGGGGYGDRWAGGGRGGGGGDYRRDDRYASSYGGGNTYRDDDRYRRDDYTRREEPPRRDDWQNRDTLAPRGEVDRDRYASRARSRSRSPARRDYVSRDDSYRARPPLPDEYPAQGDSRPPPPPAPPADQRW